MPTHSMICANCGTRFEAQRSDAATCSGACRTAIGRKRRRVIQERRERARLAELDRAAATVRELTERLNALQAAS